MKARLAPAILAAALVALAGCGSLASLAAGRPEWRKPGAAPEKYGLTGEHVTFRSADHLVVAGWWLPASAPRATVVLVHGVGGGKSSMLPQARFLVDAGYDVLTIDLRAHGESQGRYPTGGFREKVEVRAAVRYAADRTGRPVLLLGHSLGGVAVLHAAAQNEPAVVGVVADGAFVTFFDMMKRVRAQMESPSLGARIGLWIVASPNLSILVRGVIWLSTGVDVDPDGGNLIPILPKIHVPVLFVTGDRDVISPTRNARNMRRLVGALGEIAVLHASHSTYRDAPDAYRTAVLGFFDRVLARPAAVAGSAR